MVLTFVSVDEILWCNHSNETSSAVLSHHDGTFIFKGQINQKFDIFSFNPIYLLCVDLVSNKHILKFQVNWT